MDRRPDINFERSPAVKRFFSFYPLRLAFVGGVVLLALAVPARAADYWYICNPTNHVAAFLDRVHIFCQSTTPVATAPALNAAILWFAVPTSPDSATASRFMSLLQTAVITAKPIWLNLNPDDTSGSSFGCGAANCRRILGVEMR
jgi:hypothetical protein